MNTDISALWTVDWSGMLLLMLPLVLLNALLVVFTLVDWYKRRDQIETPYVWLAVILLVQTLGPILYLVIGRRVRRDGRDNETM